MTASLVKLGSGAQAGTYYTNDPYREARNRDDYYGRDGGGTWWTSGAAVVRDGAAIDVGSFRDLCAGRDPGSHSSLVRGAGGQHRAGWDVTFSAPKSFSLLWASSTGNERIALEQIQEAAVSEALRFLVDENLVEVRLGAGGYMREAPASVIVGRFPHFTTREGDPNCHTHCVLINAARSRDGKYRTIEPEALFKYQIVVGSAYRAALSKMIKREFGFILREAGRDQFEIEGLPEHVIEAFSKRSAAIKERIGGDRAAVSGAQKEVAALSTRGAKEDVPTGEELEARWRQELADLACDPWEAVRQAARSVGTRERRDEIERPLDPDPVFGETPAVQGANRVFRHENVATGMSLLHASLVAGALDGHGIEAVRDDLALLKAGGGLVPLGPPGRDAPWTAPVIAQAEAALLRGADRREERSWFDEQAVADALTSAPHLSDEQREAVLAVANRDGVAVAEAGAGTGKTTLARALVDAAARSKLSVIGLAPSWVAADELSSSTGILAFAIAKWRTDMRRDGAPPLTERSLVLVDEAGMAGTRELADILDRAHKAGAKVVLLGDRRQLASVAGASALRSVVDVVDRHATMTQVRRQEVDWQRAASVLMARGDVDAGLRAYSGRDGIELVAGAESARQRVIERWTEARARHGEDVLILTRRNRDANLLNEGARDVLRREGRITGPDIEVPTIDREGRPTLLPLATGDRLRFGENLSHLEIRNGTRAVVERVRRDATGSPTMVVRLEDGRVIEDVVAAFARHRPGRRPAPPRISHSTAGTVYSVQGRTCAEAVMYIASPTDARELYVGLTRHRIKVTLVAERGRLEAAVRGRIRDPRHTVSRSEMHEQLFAEGRRFAEKANVIDHIEDRASFTATGTVPWREGSPVSAVRRSFAAARALRRVLREIGAVISPALRELSRVVPPITRVVPAGLLELARTARTSEARDYTPRRRTRPELSR